MISNSNPYSGLCVSAPRKSHGSSSTHVFIAAGADGQLPTSYTDRDTGKTYRQVNYGTLSGTMFVETRDPIQAPRGRDRGHW